jgi:hypothetical protein
MKYRLQINSPGPNGGDLYWTEWRDLTTKSIEQNIVSIQLSEEVSWDVYNKEIAPMLKEALL